MSNVVVQGHHKQTAKERINLLRRLDLNLHRRDRRGDRLARRRLDLRLRVGDRGDELRGRLLELGHHVGRADAGRVLLGLVHRLERRIRGRVGRDRRLLRLLRELLLLGDRRLNLLALDVVAGVNVPLEEVARDDEDDEDAAADGDRHGLPLLDDAVLDLERLEHRRDDERDDRHQLDEDVEGRARCP